MKRVGVIHGLCVAGWLTMAGCADQVTCDPDQLVFEGFCLQPGGADGGTDASVDLTPYDCTGMAETGMFLKRCRSDDDCSCPAPLCAKAESAAEGFCTQVCEPDFPACPSDYTCFDPSAITPGAPKICLSL